MRLALLLAILIPTTAGAREMPRLSAFDEKPVELPPLLKVPPASQPPANGPRGPDGEYDPGYFYLPERAPDRPRPTPCGPEGRIWIGPGLELAWMKPADAPPLLRVGNAAGPVAYGGQSISSPMQAGLSLAAGLWMNEARTMGWDASFLYLNGTGSNSLVGPTADTVLVLPVGGVAAVTLADPATGRLGAFQAGLDTLFATADVNYRNNLFCSPDSRLDALVGYRYGRLSDDYEVYGKRLNPAGEIIRFRDEAHTQNHFHGGQIGLAGEWRAGRWFATGTGKVAFGVVFSEATLEGKFRQDLVVVPFGLYSRPGLSGTQERSQFAVMPAAGFSVGRQIGDHGRVSLGYQLLYMNRVARGPELMEPALTPAVAATEPATEGFWVQSFSLSAEWRY